MSSFKNKLYNYEAPPPEEMWQNIREDLQKGKAVKISGNKRSKNLYYFAVAAASLVIIFIGSMFFKNYKENNLTESVSKAKIISPEQMKDSIILNQKILESIIHNPKEKREIVSNNLKAIHIPTKYITIAGPEGQPVKISPKVATLIVYADKGFPPKPVWSNKICKWQQIMLSSTISTTSAGLADLIQLVSNKDNLQ